MQKANDEEDCKLSYLALVGLVISVQQRMAHLTDVVLINLERIAKILDLDQAI